MNSDPRIAELEALAVEEGFRLPLPAELIVWHEQRGDIVDLVDGTIYNNVTVTPEPSAQAVAYLLPPTSA